MTTAPRDSLVWKLAGLLRESGDVVLSGRSTLSLLTAALQQLNHVFELHLGPWGPGQTGFVALPSHPADSPVILQLQFLFDVLQKTLSLKRLLSALRFLNLSHNQVRDCEGFLMDLSELCHLDISYNHLRLVPRMGPSGAALGTLILRGNELQSLHGLEQLRNLRHLDVAYNLLERHRELSPLWLLAELRKTSPSSGLGPTAPPLPRPVGSTTETSGGADLSDSPSSGGVVAQPPLRKVKPLLLHPEGHAQKRPGPPGTVAVRAR
ncbi:serine/threonine-protein kinase 11-interacting protein [Pontoporia blainvillei]|uniref:Serine/threonine-protein kinase 11-interacting protein n=1 Tax=Pontoporia blainvillei TaxID=48723 RepID=A0ABX0S1C8_PONBL|nr:serine/threonine-protein kinase 11-interacting protein [Pontoporia blainvillei]